MKSTSPISRMLEGSGWDVGDSTVICPPPPKERQAEFQVPTPPWSPSCRGRGRPRAYPVRVVSSGAGGNPGPIQNATHPQRAYADSLPGPHTACSRPGSPTRARPIQPAHCAHPAPNARSGENGMHPGPTRTAAGSRFIRQDRVQAGRLAGSTRNIDLNRRRAGLQARPATGMNPTP